MRNTLMKRIVNYNKYLNIRNYSNLNNVNSYNYIKNIIPRYSYDRDYTKEINNIINDTFNNKLIEIPTVINGNEYKDNLKQRQVSPINNKKNVCIYNDTNSNLLNYYLNNYQYAKKSLESYSIKDRINTFRKAAYLLDTKYREQMIAYTIIGQGKSLYEAEIDSICELGDFLNFNSHYYQSIINKQPISFPDVKNESLYNPLNGFVAAITPFNFTAIGGNLASTPVLFGNNVIWKPSDSSVLSNYLFYQIMIEAGLPNEAIAFTPAYPFVFNSIILKNENLGGLLFTGSSYIFSELYKDIAVNNNHYNNHPRLIGETGGKNFHFIDKNIDVTLLNFSAQKTVESAYGYSGQKCSACSIVFVPDIHYDMFVRQFLEARDTFMKHKSFNNYGIINSNSYIRTKKLLNSFRNNEKYNIICGGSYNDDKSYHIEPALINCQDINDDIYKNEYFAPILSIYRYNSKDSIKTILEECRNTSRYALTGSVFSNNEQFIKYSTNYFKEKCGNFYINDKSTGSVVGQQPFGGSGKSGTNDKAGDINLLYRLFNQQNIKRNYSW